MLWTALLIALKWVGSDRVGFLSGAFRDEPRALHGHPKDATGIDTETDDTSSDDCLSLKEHGDYEAGNDFSVVLTNDNKESKATRNFGSMTVTACRFIFFGSGAIFLACLVLLYTQGLPHVQETIDATWSASGQVHEIVSDTSALVHENVPNAKALIISLRKGIQLELDRPEFCPNDPSLDDTPLASEIRRFVHDVLDQFDTLDKYLSFDSKKISEILTRLNHISGDIVDRTGTTEATGFVSAVCFVILALLPVLLSGAALMAHERVSFPKFEKIVRYLLAPLFVVAVVAAWTMLVVVLVSATMTADFCLPSGRVAGSGPDQTVLSMLEAVHEEPGSMVHQLVEHVISDGEVSANVIDMLHDYQFKTVRQRTDSSENLPINQSLALRLFMF